MRMLGRLADNLWLFVWGMAVMLMAAMFVVTWTPTAHPVHTAGAEGITVRVDAVPVEGPPFSFSDLAPTTSLSEIRCDAWRQNRDLTCPADSPELRHFWPDLVQASKTLYVWLSTLCVGFDDHSDFNVEFGAASRTLMIHCFSAAPWASLKGGPQGVSGIPETALVIVPTAAIAPGQITVIKDVRVEHPIGEDSAQTVLGNVTIPQGAAFAGD